MPLEPKIPFASREWCAFAHVVNMVRETQTCTAPPNQNITIRNALTESAMIHRRVLTEAIIAKGRKWPDDIILRDLLADPLPQAVDAPAQALEAVYSRVIRTDDGEVSPKNAMDKLLAHLTTLRGSRFDFTPHMKALDGPLHAVLRAIDDACQSHFAAGFVSSRSFVERSTQLMGATVVTRML